MNVKEFFDSSKTVEFCGTMGIFCMTWTPNGRTFMESENELFSTSDPNQKKQTD